MGKTNRKDKIIFILLTAAIFIVAVYSVSVGKYPISLEQLKALLFGGEVDDMTRRVFFTLRLPRTIMTILSGIGLGLAGCVYQILFKNPLASPDIIGIAGGANLGAAVAIVLISNSGMLAIATGAFWGGLAAVAAVSLLVKITKSSGTATYVLAGIVINAVSKTLIMTLKYFADHENELAAMDYWEMGTFGNVTLSKVLQISPFFAVGLIGVFLLRRQIELMALGDDECRTLGVRLVPIRISVLLFSTLMVSSVISITGLVSFIGLIAPHIARLILRKNNATTMFLSALLGALITLFADICVRLLYVTELPISILTTAIGVPLLVYLLCKRGKAS